MIVMAMTAACAQKRLFGINSYFYLNRTITTSNKYGRSIFIDYFSGIFKRNKKRLYAFQHRTLPAFIKCRRSDIGAEIIINNIRRFIGKALMIIADIRIQIQKNTMSDIANKIAHPIISLFRVLDSTMKEKSTIIQRFIFQLLALQQPPD